MRLRDERFLSFVVASTSKTRSNIRRFTVHRNWVRASSVLGLAFIALLMYGFYGLLQQGRHLRIDQENARLRAENERQKAEVEKLKGRVETIENASRSIVEMSGVPSAATAPVAPASIKGSGGPALPVDTAAAINDLTARATQLESKMPELRQHIRVPSIWPLDGAYSDCFGIRGNPFGGGSLEKHTGQDIKAPIGTPIHSTAAGTIIYATGMSGYGNLVEIDHGNGVTTRYGHMSKILVTQGQFVKRGDVIGLVGVTGRTTGPHVHYEVRINDEPVEPRNYLPGGWNH
jgi:murein DD-endopeptidase MepM/ murein hydrolase activator NlpD